MIDSRHGQARLRDRDDLIASAGLDLRLSAHDELVIFSDNGDRLKKNMRTLRDAMEGVNLTMSSDGRSIQTLTDGKVGPNFGALATFNDEQELA
ncbi:MAG: hypothetical protein ACLQDV_06070 [Candidatus Binataceae bacterium]